MASIHHPTIDGPVSLRRAIMYRLAVWMMDKGREWEDRALFPERTICPDCGQRMQPGGVCDHIPF